MNAGGLAWRRTVAGRGWRESGHEHDATHSSSAHTGTIAVVTTARPSAVSFRNSSNTFIRLVGPTGSGCGVSIRLRDPDLQWRVYVDMAPSGIQKETMIGEDIFGFDTDCTAM